TKAKTEPDKERAKKYLEAAQKLADTEDIDIFNRPEYQKTAKQVFGEGLGTFLEAASFGSFGGATKIPTILKPLTKGGSILQATKQGAAIGGTFGSAFGVSEAMINDKSIGGIVQEGLISGTGGALLGGALGGGTTATFQGISGLLSRASKLSQKGKALLSKTVTQKLEQTSRDLVKMSPTKTANEARWNKNTPNFIANEFVIDEKTLKPKSILQLIDSDGKRIDTTEAINALRAKYREESRAFNSLIKDSGEYASFNQLRDRTIKTISDDYKTKGSDYESALKYINKEIDAYKRNYRQVGLIDGDDVLIPVSEMSRIKSGLWDKTSNFNPTQSDKLLSDLNYRMGQTAKDLIEENVQDVAVKRMNQRLGDFASAIKVLENAQGKVLPGGFFGRQFTRLAGTVAGSTGGVGGSIVGNITGGALADIMVDPRIKTSIWTKLYQSLNKTAKGKSIIDEAVEILKKRGQERASRKLLEAPKFIPLGAKQDTSRSLTQEEARALLDSLKIKPKKIKLNQTGKAEPLKSKQKLDSLNPTGSVFSKYTPKQRATAELADNITTLDKTMGKSANETITIYKGSNYGSEIVPGDFITTNKQLAKDYAGTGKVLEKRVKLSDILDDITEPLGEEYIYRPKSTPLKSNLINEARKYKTAEEFIKAQGTPVYRGDATPIKLSEMDTTKVFNPAEKEALGAFNNTPGLYFTDSVANAKSYGKNLTEVSVKQTANVINVSDAPKILRRADVEKIIRSNPRIKDWAMNWDENFDKAIKQITDSVMAEKDGNEFLKAIWSDGGFSEGDFVKAMQNAGIDGLKIPKEGVNHFVIYNKDALKTKSQLTDIWNKANK
ncbi:MAG: hypothetical protein ACOYIG_13320, partial [Acetivibrionales bacterium]